MSLETPTKFITTQQTSLGENPAVLEKKPQPFIFAGGTASTGYTHLPEPRKVEVQARQFYYFVWSALVYGQVIKINANRNGTRIALSLALSVTIWKVHMVLVDNTLALQFHAHPSLPVQLVSMVRTTFIMLMTKISTNKS